MTLEGNTNDSDMLLEELGVFYLNEEIKKAYEKVIILKEEYKNKIQAINKPVVYSEGNNTKYLEVAKELFLPDLEYDIESLGGKTEIKKFFTMFSNANFNRFKILFVFDCDAETEFQYCEERKTEYLEPYIFKKNENNTLPETQKGIENLFNDDLFDDENRHFSITTVDKDQIIQSRKRNLRKNDFLNYIKNENNTKDAFYLFTEVQELIRLKFSE